MVMGEMTQEVGIAVIGGGPGGYAAAFRAADLGLDVMVIDEAPRLGGVCLHRGCIPSKALLHLSQLINDAKASGELGIVFGAPTIDLEKVRAFKNRVVDRLSDGLMRLAKQRGVQVVQARAVFEDSRTLRLQGADLAHIKFGHAIVATGSSEIALPGLTFRPGGRVISSTGALELADVPGRLLVIGGGYVGLELGSVYAALGSQVSVVEMLPRLIAQADEDLARPLVRRIGETFEAVYTRTKVADLTEGDADVEVTLEGAMGRTVERFDRVLVAVGRRPHSRGLGLEHTKVVVDDRGFIQVDDRQQTAEPKIFAIGDVVGGMMLAHKAMYEGKIAAEVIAGQPAAFDAVAIPAVVYTDPSLAWAGLTETDAQAQGREVRVARFPWSASGRALTMDAPEGLTKILADAETGRVLGFGIVGRDAGEMIGEGVLAIELGALVEDVALTIHAHPTLTETEGEVAELFLGSTTHLLPPKQR
ncbi:MAG: dihydrolipoyl dehydrogenase [Anaerolineae bacterium]|nr:dihydrolipoyl dehydrogenase [Anaerolineae bacterium]